MAWRLSHALEQLRSEVDAAHPDRSRISDGTIGDPAHQARLSDHNPDAAGIVHAWDLTADEELHVAQAVVDFIIATRPDRLKYMIWQDRIMSGPVGPRPWIWRPYQPDNPGRNRHKRHAHISTDSDDGAPWGYPTTTEPEDDMFTDQDRELLENLDAKLDRIIASERTDTARQLEDVRGMRKLLKHFRLAK